METGVCFVMGVLAVSAFCSRASAQVLPGEVVSWAFHPQADVVGLSPSLGDGFGRGFAEFPNLLGTQDRYFLAGIPGKDKQGFHDGDVALLRESPSGQVSLVALLSQTVPEIASGMTQDERLGWAVCVLGDLDEDGWVEVAISSPWRESKGEEAGGLWLLSLNELGQASKVTLVDAAEVLTETSDETRRFGCSLASWPSSSQEEARLLIGAGDTGFALPHYGGSVYELRVGADHTITWVGDLNDWAALTGDPLVDDDLYGSSVAVSKPDADGVRYVSIGAMGDEPPNQPAAFSAIPGGYFLFRMAADGSITDAGKLEYNSPLMDEYLGIGHSYDFGRATTWLPDANGDGVPELVVTAPRWANAVHPNTERGAVFVVALDADLQAKYVTFIGSHAGGLDQLVQDGDDFGRNVALLGDGLLAVGMSDISTINEGAMWFLELTDGLWVDVAGGTPGGPVLTGAGFPTATEEVSVLVEAAPPNVPGLLVMGVEAANAPVAGGVLVPVAQFVEPLLVTDSQGEGSLAGRWPSGWPVGLSVYLQGWFPEQVGGFVGSNGLVVTPTT
jgi:hypothetical protein